MDLGCFDLGCVSLSDKRGTEAAAVDSKTREDDVSANSKIGKVNSLFFHFQPSTSGFLFLSFFLSFAVLFGFD
jgi:hypothetical protein